jgi:hypothetical protein
MNIGEPGWRPTAVHPLADLFPLMSEDDLKELAADIKANGQLHPIVIDAEGVLVDGRNRLAACDLVKVEPRFESLNGHDAEALIWSANTRRRQMTKGQIAMIGAMSFRIDPKTPSPKGGRPDKGQTSTARAVGVDPKLIAKALLIKEYASDLVSDVIGAKITLDVGHTTAQARKKQAEWRDDGLRVLTRTAPDIATRVVEGEIDLDAGRKLLQEREKAEYTVRDSVLVGALTMVQSASNFDHSDALKRLPEWATTPEGEEHLKRYFSGGADDAQKRIAEAKKGLLAVEATFKALKRSASKGSKAHGA